MKRIDEVMTGGANWRREGLGETGETYPVGSDDLMRSDSRFEIVSAGTTAASRHLAHRDLSVLVPKFSGFRR